MLAHGDAEHLRLTAHVRDTGRLVVGSGGSPSRKARHADRGLAPLTARFPFLLLPCSGCQHVLVRGTLSSHAFLGQLLPGNPGL